MTEQFSLDNEPNSADSLLGDFEKAFTDPILLASTRRAKELAASIDMSGDTFDIEQQTEAHRDELNQQSWTIHDMSGKASGTIHMYDEDHKDYREVSISSAIVHFGGFESDFDQASGKVHFNYELTIAYDPEANEVLSTEILQKINENNEDNRSRFVEAVVYANPDELFIELDVLHPIRAYAWLEMSYPEILRDLDNRIIHAGAGSDERSILGLRGFEIDMSKISDIQEIQMYRACVNMYINAMISIDNQVPYEMDIDGDCMTYDIQEGNVWHKMQEEDVLYSVESLSFYTRNNEEGNPIHLYQFGLTGDLHGDDIDTPSQGVAIPLRAVQSLASSRRKKVSEEEG